MIREIPSTKHKALVINLDKTIFGSFAEIGAGQEVARHFFQSGGASGTIARTMSAYDMAFSDSLYGKTADGRYVTKPRLEKMLDYEYKNLVSILSDKKDESTRFFVFADTISALNFNKDNIAHGWLGMRFQLKSRKEYNDVIIHVRLFENDNLLQQRTLGELGVNLIYACYFYHENRNTFLESLMDNLSNDRLDIDMIEVNGPELSYMDNRLLSVQLVRKGMAKFVIFDRCGKVQQPSDLLHNKDVIVFRGSFRPITYVGFDMLKTGYAMFKKESDYDKENTVQICEIALDNLMSEGELDERDFLDRVDILCGMGQNVVISNFQEFYKLTAYFSWIKIKNIRLIIGAGTFLYVIDEKYYKNLKGGILEAFGRLFTNNVKIYLYPAKKLGTDKILTTKNLPVPDKIRHLYDYLIENKKIIDIENAKTEKLYIYSHLVVKKIKNKEEDWVDMVPKYVSEFIKSKKIFGYKG